MRVGIDAINLLADERGMGRYVRRIIAGLAARADFELTLLVRDPERAAAYREAVGADVTFARLESARKRSRYDAVWYPWNAVRFDARAPSLVTVNDDFAFRYPARGFVARRREQLPIRRAVAHATRLATISQWSRAQLAERFRLDPETIAVLPLAPDPFFTPAREASPRALPFVLAVGGAEKRKNIPFLRKVFRRAFPGGGVELVVVGGGRGEPPVDDRMLRRLYRTAAVVAVPSLAEGFGLVAAEAQACGAPVIAAHTSALPEAAGDAAVSIDPAYRDAWVDALRTIAGDAALQARLAQRGAARWAFAPRDAATSAVADLLRDLR